MPELHNGAAVDNPQKCDTLRTPLMAEIKNLRRQRNEKLLENPHIHGIFKVFPPQKSVPLKAIILLYSIKWDKIIAGAYPLF